MKIFEIILKVLFLAGSIYSIRAESIQTPYLIAYLVICLVLGVVLFFNKKQSYGYELANREIVIRKIEGVLLGVFAIFAFIVQVLNF